MRLLSHIVVYIINSSQTDQNLGLYSFKVFVGFTRSQRSYINCVGTDRGADQMPRYFFHIRDGSHLIPDDEGMEFSDFELAEVEGYSSARDLATADLWTLRRLGSYAVEITDDDGDMMKRIVVEPIYRMA